MSKNEITRRILSLLLDRHKGDGWLRMPELRCGTGLADDSDRYIDLFVMFMWNGKKVEKHTRIAYEIKSNRGDFLNDISRPIKQRPAILHCTYFYWVAPVGIIKPEELPLDTGLIEYHEENKSWRQLQNRVESARFDYAPNWSFCCSLIRAVTNGRFNQTPSEGDSCDSNH